MRLRDVLAAILLAVVAMSGTLTAAIKRDPEFFSEKILGRTRWEGQKEIARSVRDNRVTHVRSGHSLGKTNEFAATLIEWLLTNRDGRVLITGPTFNQVKQSLWKEVRELYFKAAERGFPLGNGMRKEEWELSDRHDARLAAVDNISAIQGGRGAKCLVIVDEAQGVEDELWDALDSLMTAEGSRMLTGGNPLFARGRWHQMHEDDVEANLIRLDAETHPNILTGREIIPGGITRMWIDMMRRKHGPDYLSSPVYQGRVLGEFPTDGVFQVISLGMLEDAAKGTEGVKGEDRVAGLDVARHGTDRNVFIVLDETRTVVHVDSWTGLDLDETADRAKALCVEHGIELQPKSGPGHLKIDIGMGAGVRDILKRTVKVELVDFGSKPGNDWSGLLNKGEGGKATMRFLNRRAYLHWVARELLKARALSIPKRFREVWADLRRPTYDQDEKGQLFLHSKKASRTKPQEGIGKSPDFGDALVIALSRGGTRSVPAFASSSMR